MIILIDKAEQEPYTFGTIQTLYVKLLTGDYTIQGLEDKITIERKSLCDFIKTLSVDRARFTRELKRMQNFDYACIVVEGGLTEIFAKPPLHNCNVSAERILGSTVSFLLDYRIPVFFCADRQHAILFTEKLLTMYYEHYKEDNK